MYMYSTNSSQLILYLIAILVVVYAQSKFTGTYKKYRTIPNASNLTGQEAARKILAMHGLDNVDVEIANGSLSDHYDPSTKVVRLSSEVYSSTTIASISIAAHECGHALQDKEGYWLLRLRASLVGVVNFATKIGWFLLVLGAFLFYRSSLLFKIGALVLLCVLVFQLVTLPVELDASSRAMKILKEDGLILENESSMAGSMLKAAAFTYLAATISTLTQLLRVLLIISSRDRKD